MPDSKYWRKPYDASKIKRPHGTVMIIEDRCKGCAFCVEFCPKDVLVLSIRFNKKGYHPPEVVIPDGCVNCDLCQRICPEFAIYSVSKDEVKEESEELIKLTP